MLGFDDLEDGILYVFSPAGIREASPAETDEILAAIASGE